MDEFSEQSPEETLESGQPTTPRWKGVQWRKFLYRLNERCVDLLIDAVASNSPLVTLPVLLENRKLWIRFDPQGRERLAQIPFVIVDAQFSDDAQWTGTMQGQQIAAEPNGLPKDVSEALMLEVLILAWQLANADRTAAMMCFGMSLPVAEAIAALTPQDIRDVAVRERETLQLRWAGDLRFWAELLLAAQNGAEEKLSELSLQAELLLCSPLAKIKG